MRSNSTYHIASNGQYWQLSWRDSTGKRRRKSLGAKRSMTRKQAEAEMQRVIQEHVSIPALVDVPKSGTLGHWVDRYFMIREDELDEATVKIHRRTAALLLEFFPASARIDTMNKSMATDWRINLKKAKLMGEATVCKHCRTAKVILGRAVSEDVAAVHYFGHLKGTAPKKQVFDRTAISLDLVQDVLKHSGDEATALITIGFFTGMRTTEILHLRWEHVDTQRNVITVVPRGGVETSKQRLREVRIEPELWTWLASREETGGTVIGMIEAGRQNLAARLVKEACTAAGVAPFTIQQLRQTRDTIWHREFPSHVACAWLGHSEQTARQHYLSVPEDMYCHNDATNEKPSPRHGRTEGNSQWAQEAHDLPSYPTAILPMGGLR